MSAYKSLKRRSNKMRSRAIFSGLLFVLGTIGLAVVAFLPLMVNVDVQGYGALTVSNFWQPIADLFGDMEAFLADPAQPAVAAFSGLLFGLMVLFTVINALRAISKLDRLCMHGNRRVGFNQNKIAVDKLAKIFSCSYALVSVHTLIIMALNPAADMALSLVFMITTIAYLAIHIITGPIVGSISTFTIRDFVAEKPRTHGGFGPFVRNIFQFAAIGGVFFFIMQLMQSVSATPIEERLIEKDLLATFVQAICNMPATIQDFGSGNLLLIFQHVCEVLCVIGGIAFLGFFRHAINFTEFWAYGEKAKGRKSARVASFILFLTIFLLWAHPIILHIVESGVFPAWNAILDESYGKLELLYAAAVMLGMFIIECILAKCPKMKRKYRGTTGEVALVYDMPDADGEMMAKSAMGGAPVMMAPNMNGKDPVMMMVSPNGQPVMMVPTPMMQPVAMPVAPAQPVQPVAPVQPAQPVAPAQPVVPVQPVQYVQPAPVAPVAPVQTVVRPAPAPVQTVVRPAPAPVQTVVRPAPAPVQTVVRPAPVVAPAQPVARPVQAAPVQPAVVPVKSLQPTQYVQPVQGTVPTYSAADINAIKNKWVQRGLAGRQNQNKNK